MEKIIHNVLTDEIEIKELTSEEIAQREADAKAFAEVKAKKEAELAAQAAAKAELLNRLGITEDEAKLLLA